MERLGGPKRIAGVMAIEEVCILAASVDKKPHGEQGVCSIFFPPLGYPSHFYRNKELNINERRCEKITNVCQPFLDSGHLVPAGLQRCN
jgi:hypothetical protein